MLCVVRLGVRVAVRSSDRLIVRSFVNSFGCPSVVHQFARLSVCVFVRSVLRPVICPVSQLVSRSVSQSVLDLNPNLFYFRFQASDYAHVPVTLDTINVKTVGCPTELTKSFPVKIKEKDASTFVVGIEKNALIGEQVHLKKYDVAWINLWKRHKSVFELSSATVTQRLS